MLRSSALRSRRGRGIIRIRNAPIFIIAGLSPNITACYLLVRSYRLIGVGHHFDFPSFVPQTSITTVDPSFGLINLNDFISGQSCFFPSTRPTSAASSTAASTPTTRTLSRHGAALYDTLRIEDQFGPPGKYFIDDSYSVHNFETPERAVYTSRRVRSSTRTTASTTATGTFLRISSDFVQLCSDSQITHQDRIGFTDDTYYTASALDTTGLLDFEGRPREGSTTTPGTSTGQRASTSVRLPTPLRRGSAGSTRKGSSPSTAPTSVS